MDECVFISAYTYQYYYEIYDESVRNRLCLCLKIFIHRFTAMTQNPYYQFFYLYVMINFIEEYVINIEKNHKNIYGKSY